MIHLRATARLRKRLRQPVNPPEPQGASPNPLGEWYAEIDFIDREPFVLLLNAATGVGLVLPGRAADLRALHDHARDQLGKLFLHFAMHGPRVQAELDAWRAPPVYAKTRDRSLLGSMNQFKDAAWSHFAYCNRALPEAAAKQWAGLFRPPPGASATVRGKRQGWEHPLALACARLDLPPPPPPRWLAEPKQAQAAGVALLELASLAGAGGRIGVEHVQPVIHAMGGCGEVLLDCRGVAQVSPAFVDAVQRFADANPDRVLLWMDPPQFPGADPLPALAPDAHGGVTRH